MRRTLRENAPCALAAAAGCSMLAWLGLYGIGWNDYETEAAPAVEALVAGHLHKFLALSPVYGGSLIERAPFALLPGLWGGGHLAVYRMLALPCLLASAALAVRIVARMRAAGRPPLARAVALGVIAVNPLTLRALELGHPEELLGACACVAAVLLAAAPAVTGRRSLAVGALLGLAIANKQWALLAAGPVLLALPPGRRAPAALAAGTIAALLQAPLLLASSSGFAAGAGAAVAPGSQIFQPWQLFWFLGHHGAPVHGLFGSPKPGYRDAPAWAGTVSHPLVLASGAALAAARWRRGRGVRLDVSRALLALGVTMLLRCLLDTWDTVYYLLPAVLALLAWEAERPGGRTPLLALAVTLVAWAQFQWLPERVSPDAQSAVFLVWMLPLTGVLAARLLGVAMPRSRTLRRAGAQPTTARSFGRPVSRSQPSSRTTVRSSIRTPSTPGR